jgi:hypothetical protein
MTFEQHLQNEIKKLKEADRDVRHPLGQARQVLLPLRDSHQIQHLIREIREVGGVGRVE